MNELVSIIIPNFNGAQFLLEAVSSAIKQNYLEKEIIVVDDGSTDNSLEILGELGLKIRVVATSNLGASAARNAGILAANGEYLAFLDSDDVWVENKLSLQMDYMEKTDSDLVYCHGQEFGSPDGVDAFHEAIFSGDCYKYFRQFPGRAIIDMGPSTALIKKSLLSVSGIFDSSFTGPAEDWDFFRRYCRTAKVGFCDQVLVHRRNHSNNVSHRSLKEYYSGNRRALLKMFAEDSRIGILERRLIWFGFNFAFTKSFMKGGLPINAFRSLIRICMPITF
mgnify:CR=1 FL=1